ncbi:glycosyltransferase family 4 protein [Paenibacillus chitinolyticus]|uniref:glycosyltransferase family 4 protein n=1 Tax=Paenibacillus chitinolyticus TaxID=79263 RepID=UPI0000E5F1BE|nr:glycosyltransferase family 4 protein [Paenibacillus chitinolyticus]MEC0247483.1 glycosyltransferase family 4 protein [Paenibacillus chitinolyticus]
METDRKKIAFVATVFGHLEAFHIPYMTMLKNKGYEVHAYGAVDHGYPGISNQYKSFPISFNKNPFHKDNWKAYLDLVTYFKENEYSMVHFHTPIASIVGRLAAKKAKIPSVLYTAHGFHFHTGAPLLNWFLYYPIERIMARYTDYLITINKEDYLRAKRFKVRKETIYLPGIGVDTSAFDNMVSQEYYQALRNSLGLQIDDFIVTCVAELNSNKNQEQLIRAIHILVSRYPYLKCLFIGQGNKAEYYKDQVTTLQLNDQIQFLGFRRDIPQLLAISQVVALVSKREGLPKALLEGMSAGKALFGTKIRGISDLIKDGKNGFLVEVSNIPQSVEALESMLQDPQMVNEMGLQSKCLVSKYDLSLVIDEMNRIYEKALSKNTIGYTMVNGKPVELSK